MRCLIRLCFENKFNFVVKSVTIRLINNYLYCLVLLLRCFLSPGAYLHNSAGDRGEAYVHDTTGDFGPYHYWKLRQQVGPLSSLASSHLCIFAGEGARKKQPGTFG